MVHHNFSMLGLLSVSMSQYRRNNYDHSIVNVDDAIQDENRNPYVQYQGAQTLGIEKVVPPPDIAT